MDITDENLKEFKESMKIYHTHSDSHLKRLLQSSYKFLSKKCGAFPMDEENEGKELVFSRARYAHNDAVEYFDDNFMSMVINFSLSNLPEKENDNDENTDEPAL